MASIMGLDEGDQRLELVFTDGNLRQWWSHAEKRQPRELGRFDEQAGWLLHPGGGRFDPRDESR